ncbi:hypothetical protein [Pseudomonas alkylphenolica]|uniref:hypothetical protein n=1 Tax=Pseudomonas alkylphenolica TaxID=237609 RepID=UPI0019D4723A|nr:hypothetical protein [Pseudomonas alkylphenolica]
MIEYPAELPVPLQDGYALDTPVDPMLRTKMESGRARQRLNFDEVPYLINAKWNCDRNQMAFFQGWYARELIQGVEWFKATLLTPIGFKEYECRFAGHYTGPSLVQVSRWEISATLELREPPLMNPGWEDFPQYWFMMNIIDLALNREWPEMVFDYPTYAAAIAAIRTLRPGLTITIERDETHGGKQGVYQVVRADSPSLSIDFLSQTYLVGQTNDYLLLVRSYGG